MNLYKDYKQQCEMQNKEQEDREKLGIPSEVTVIYEPTRAMTIIRSAFNAFSLAALLVGIGAVVIALTFYLA